MRNSYELLAPLSLATIIITKGSICKDLVDAGMTNDDIVWILKEEADSFGELLDKSAKHLAECDWTFILTAHKPFDFFNKISQLTRSVLLIHNSHAFINPLSNVFVRGDFSILIFLRFCRFIIFRDRKTLKQLLQNVNILAFPSEVILEHLRKQSINIVDNRSIFLPLGIYKRPISGHQYSKSHSIQICIPGTIKSNGRNYRTAYIAIKGVLNEIKKPIHLCLLGRPQKKNGLEIQKKFSDLGETYPHFSVQYFTETISQYEFDQELIKADFIILPLAKYSRYDAFREQVGISTISGGINDMLRFGIPTILPWHYPKEQHWAPLTAHYQNTKGLKQIIQNWINTGEYTTRALSYRQKNLNTLETVRREFVKILG